MFVQKGCDASLFRPTAPEAFTIAHPAPQARPAKPAAKPKLKPVKRDVKPQAPAQRIVMHQRAVNAQFQRRLIRQISHTYGTAADLILIGWPNTASRRADLCHGILRLARTVEFAVDRQDQRRVLGNHQSFGGNRHTLPAQTLDFFFQMPWIKDNTVTDHASCSLTVDT